MNQKVKKTKWFWPWQDQEEEKWLESQSQKGLHLENPSYFGIYTFIEGDPTYYQYRLDYYSDKQKDKDAYIQIFEDAGWEYLGSTSWQYFRKIFRKDESTDIFTDTQSKVKKYERLLNQYAGFWLIIFVTIFPIRNLDDYVPWLQLVLFLLNFAILFINIFIMMKIYNRIKTLKQSIKE